MSAETPTCAGGGDRKDRQGPHLSELTQGHWKVHLIREPVHALSYESGEHHTRQQQGERREDVGEEENGFVERLAEWLESEQGECREDDDDAEDDPDGRPADSGK